VAKKYVVKKIVSIFRNFLINIYIYFFLIICFYPKFFILDVGNDISVFSVEEKKDGSLRSIDCNKDLTERTLTVRGATDTSLNF